MIDKTQKVKIQELWLLHYAHCLMLIDICMKFYKDSLNGFQVIGQTQLRPDFVMDKVPREITQMCKCKSYCSCILIYI